MKVEYNKYQITFKCGNYDEYIKFVKVLDRLITCWCNRHGGICKICMLGSIVDGKDADLCDIFTHLYNSAL